MERLTSAEVRVDASVDCVCIITPKEEKGE